MSVQPRADRAAYCYAKRARDKRGRVPRTPSPDADVDRDQARKRIQALSREIAEHDHRYYALDRPSVSDAEYDRRFRELKDLEEAHPDLRLPDSPTLRVGGGMRVAFRRCHAGPMRVARLADGPRRGCSSSTAG